MSTRKYDENKTPDGPGSVSSEQSILSDLRAVYRSGQVFLHWQERNLPETARLTVWGSPRPITRKNLDSADCLAKHLNPGSARDWWLDRSSFLIEQSNTLRDEEIFAGDNGRPVKTDHEVPGFVVENGGQPLDPCSGLHVHTPGAEQCGKRYFAVTWEDSLTDSPLEFTATDCPVDVKMEPVQPVVLQGPALSAHEADGLPLVVHLHGRGGGVGVDADGSPHGTHLWFSDRTTAWREGIPFKFDAVIEDGVLNLTLNDRIWTGRRLTPEESSDARDHVPAIATFWMGYNPDIATGNFGPDFKIDNYTERLTLAIIRWAQNFLGCDVNRTFLIGGSMGGTGAVQMALHFPEVFAAVRAFVPIYSYTWKKSGDFGPSISRLQCTAGQFTPENSARMPDGTDILEYGDGCRFAARRDMDIPPIFATNGRRDASMPWINNPPFFKAANQGRQALTVYWNHGDHSMSKDEPEDMKRCAAEMISRYRLNESFPAFSDRSDNSDYGNGDMDDGSPEGWINRGISWTVSEDREQCYEIALKICYPKAPYPITGSVTIRRRQYFLPQPQQQIKLEINSEKRTVQTEQDGTLTIKSVVFSDDRPVRIRMTYVSVHSAG